MNNSTPNLNDSSEANLHAIDYWQVLRNRYGIIILATLLIFATAAIITHVIPKKYKSSATIAVHPPQAGINPINGMNSADTIGAVQSRNYLETQIKLITSELNLSEVEKELNLSAQWGVNRDDAISRLKAITSTVPEIGTDLVIITVEHRNDKECKQIAQAVANAYSTIRQRDEQDNIDQQLSTLDSELQKQVDKVQNARNILDQIVQSTGVVPQRDSQIGQTENSIYIDALKRSEQLKEDQRTLESQIGTMMDKSDEDLIATAAGLQIVQSRVPKLYEELIESNRALESFKTGGYGNKHPKMIAAITQNNRLRKDVRVAVSELRETLQARLQLVKADVTEQENVVSELKGKAIGTSLSRHDYDEANEAFEEEKGIYQNMKITYSAKRIQIKMPKKIITIYENAKLPANPSFPNVKLNLAIGGILGLIVGIGLAFFLELIDTSVKSLDDVERYLQVPVLAVIPKDISVLHKEGGNTPDAEAYRILRTNIEFNRKNPDDNCITVVSGGAGEGKSTTLCNLAYVCAQGGYSTLIIDADLRRPRLHTFFDINNSVGLSNYLTTDLSLEDVVLQTPVENLYFMPSGMVPSDAAGILNSSRMADLIGDVKQRFDLVLIDSPPILGVSDAAVISSEADQTMLVIQHRKLPRNMLMRVKQAVENVGGDIIGVVLNNVDIRSDNQYQYYTSYYTYYSPTEDEDINIKRQTNKETNKPQRVKNEPSNPSGNDSIY